jgi:hypothetical protein
MKHLSSTNALNMFYLRARLLRRPRMASPIAATYRNILELLGNHLAKHLRIAAKLEAVSLGLMHLLQHQLDG